MEEKWEALCRRMTARVQNQQELEERGRHKGARGREITACGRQVSADQFRDDGECNLPLPECRGRDRTSPKYLKSQGPEVHTVPPQLLSMLRLKTVKEDMRRAAEVELQDPAACRVCEQERASLALRSFIGRKKTQLKLQTLTGRLNTHLSYGEDVKSILPKGKERRLTPGRRKSLSELSNRKQGQLSSRPLNNAVSEQSSSGPDRVHFLTTYPLHLERK
ncbi:uncharacterized protein [Pseudochaenichthys georgianus]|uniref:uncharacterized protein isoform X1 n=1 Tax=Pseudochaenichthys georgianus TaxID=52239 RepID=UPI00146E296B|nr:uncharacterized protein LOC117454014 isoform X1 [Pseudochaenichthys georgianus]